MRHQRLCFKYRFIITTVSGGFESFNHSLSLLKPSRGFAILLNNYEFIVKVAYLSLLHKWQDCVVSSVLINQMFGVRWPMLVIHR